MDELSDAVMSCSCRGTDEKGNYNIHGGFEIPILIKLSKEGNMRVVCPLCPDNTCWTPNNRNYHFMRGFCAYTTEYNRNKNL